MGFKAKQNIPDVAMAEVPPPNWLNMLDTQHISNDTLIQDQMSQHHVVRRVTQHMTDPKNRLFALHLTIRRPICACIYNILPLLFRFAQSIEDIDATPQTLDLNQHPISHLLQTQPYLPYSTASHNKYVPPTPQSHTAP